MSDVFYESFGKNYSKRDRELIERDRRMEDNWRKQQKCDHFDTYGNGECVYCGIVLKERSMSNVVIEVKMEWDDWGAKYQIRGYKDGSFIRSFTNEESAKEWEENMKKHYLEEEKDGKGK